jgi:hypothetical protein
MTRQARFRWALTLGSLLLFVLAAIRIPHWNPEEFAAYEATIREAFSGDDVSHYVILDTAEPAGRFGISDFHSERLVLPLARTERLSGSRSTQVRERHFLRLQVLCF